MTPVGNVLLLDWHEDARIPRGAPDGTAYYEWRAGASPAAPTANIAGLIVHNTGGYEDIEDDNAYHRNKTDWVLGDPSVRAPHIAYHFWSPRDPAAWLAEHGIAGSPDAVIVWCNHFWERGWHATMANSTYLGIAFQIDGEAEALSDGQLTALHWLLDVWLPGQGVSIPRDSVFGHGETPAVYGGGPDFLNNTVCPGRYVLPQVRGLRAAAGQSQIQRV